MHGLAQAALAHTCSGSGDVNSGDVILATPELSQPGPQIHTERKVNIIQPHALPILSKGLSFFNHLLASLMQSSG